MKRRGKRLTMLLAATMLLTACSEKESNHNNIEEIVAEKENMNQSVTEEIFVTVGDSDIESDTERTKEVIAEKIEEVEDVENFEETSIDVEEPSIDFDEEIKAHFCIKKEYEMQIRVLMLANMEKASYITISGEDSDYNYRKMITDALVADSIDNDIISEAAKSAIDAICDGKTAQEIINETAKGVVSGAEDYIASSITEAMEGDISQILDCQLFDEVSWVNEFINANDTPIGLLNGMVSRQKSDVELLLSLISKDALQTGDLSYASGIYERICARQEEIISAGGTVSSIGQQELIDELIELCKLENASIIALSRLEDQETDVEEDSENFYTAFRNYNLQGLPACYDVSAYREQQKYTEQSGMLTGKIFGDLSGAMATQDLESNQRSVQENRVSFYSYLEGILEDSYAQVCVAREAFDELYDAEYASLDIPFENRNIIDDSEIYDLLANYMDAVTKYTYDLQVATKLWNNTLSENEALFVNSLNTQLQSNYDVLNEGIDICVVEEGYSIDEEEVKYSEIIDRYIEYLNCSMIYSSYETTFSGVSNVTAYGVGNFDVYYKGKDSTALILAEEQLETNWHQQRYLWIYDMEGYPIYIRNQYGTVYIKDGVLIRYVGSDKFDDENIAYSMINTAKRILQDLKAGSLRNSYKDYAM